MKNVKLQGGQILQLWFNLFDETVLLLKMVSLKNFFYFFYISFKILILNEDTWAQDSLFD